MHEASIKISAELFALAESSHFEGTLTLPLLTVGPDDYHFDAPVRWEVDVTNTGAALLVQGRAAGVGMCACSRCLEDVEVHFDGEIEGYFLIGEDSVSCGDDHGENDMPLEDEFDVLPADHVINLQPLIIAALIVDADTMPLCRDDCKGLCPQCGSNLNKQLCDCGADEDLKAFEIEANPFSVLAEYRFD